MCVWCVYVWCVCAYVVCVCVVFVCVCVCGVWCVCVCVCGVCACGALVRSKQQFITSANTTVNSMKMVY